MKIKEEIMKTHVLPNGLGIILAPRRAMNTAAVVVCTPWGARTETKATCGIGHLVEHLIGRTSRQFPTIFAVESAVDWFGGECNAELSADVLWMYLALASRGLMRGLELMADLVLHPLISSSIVEAEKGVILQEIAEQTPADLAANMLDATMYGPHPLGLPWAGLEENLERFTVEEVRAHLRRVLKANTMVITVVGQFDQEKVLSFLRANFGRLQPGYPPKIIPYTRAQRGRKIRIAHSPDNQTQICLGFRTVPYRHSDRLPLSLLANILGERDSSRLHTRLRKEGTVYNPTATSWCWFDTGQFTIHTGTAPEKVHETVNIIMEELRELRSRLIPTSEFDLAKAHLSATTRSRLDDPLYLARSYAGQHTANSGEIVPHRQYLKLLRKVSRRRVRDAARRYFMTSRLNLVVLGPLPNGVRKEVFRVARL